MFDAKKTTREIIDFIKDYYQNNNLKGAVIGLSGGKDSAVCLALMVKALGNENVLALWLPINSKESDKKDAIMLSKKLKVSLEEFDLSNYSCDFINDLKSKSKANDNDLHDVSINLKPRLRMMTLYAYAAMMSKKKKENYIVVGTSNKSERFVGYFTKGGDGIGDIFPIANFYVDEVIQIGDYLKLPSSITHKTPDDGLSGISDEEKLGFTYLDVKKVSEEYENNIIDKTIPNNIRNKILKAHQTNLHKFIMPAPKRETKRLGIYMGSFNPPHKGHIKVINYLLENNYVDNILIVPTLNYWNKKDLISVKDRIRMLKFYENNHIKVDDHNNKYIYTYELIKELEKEYPNQELTIIMGSDNYLQLDKWKNYEELLKYHIIVMNRGNKLKDKKENIQIINDFPYLPISSTEVRNHLSIKYLDKEVLDYIKKHNLY